LDDPELSRGFAAREGWAYEAAYRLHGRTLYAAAFGVLRVAQDAQDCVHDVLLRLWQRGGDFRIERGSLVAFLAVCVRNEALSRLRKRGNRERIEQTATPSAAGADVGNAVADRASVDAALRRLNDKERRTVSLAYYRHLTHAEIAAELREPVGTVKSRLSSALRNLRAAFPREESDYAGR
jgi:RNA polymerase sigma-70 factor, ECF subfamily